MKKSYLWFALIPLAIVFAFLLNGVEYQKWDDKMRSMGDGSIVFLPAYQVEINGDYYLLYGYDSCSYLSGKPGEGEIYDLVAVGVRKEAFYSCLRIKPDLKTVKARIVKVENGHEIFEETLTIVRNPGKDNPISLVRPDGSVVKKYETPCLIFCNPLV